MRNNNCCKSLKVSSVALALALVLVMALPFIVAANGATVSVGSADLDSGEIANIPVEVSDFPEGSFGLGGYNLKVDFTSGVIEVLEVLAGDYPFDDSPTRNINNAAGWVNLAAFQTKELFQPTGDFTIAYLRIKATGVPGDSTDLTLTINEFVDADAEPVAATPVNGRVTIKTVAPPSPPVGGKVYPTNKIGVLASWITIATAIIAGTIIFMRRRRAQR